MKLTKKLNRTNFLKEKFNINLADNSPVIALAGNPNTGKSTLFNSLTGLKQHTGNWPGKTVTRAQGYYFHKDKKYTIIDLPGTYSLLANSTEEIIARDFICFAKPDCTIVVADATNLERNLNLILQINELTNQVILCLNLMDEAKRKRIKIDIKGLEDDLQIPVVPTIARDGKGVNKLKNIVAEVINKKRIINPLQIDYSFEIKEAVENILFNLKTTHTNLENYINLHWLALRLLEGDTTILYSLQNYYYSDEEEIQEFSKESELQPYELG